MVGGSRQKTAAQKKKNVATCGAGGTILQGRQHSGLLVTHHGHSNINGNLSYHSRMRDAETNAAQPVLQSANTGTVGSNVQPASDLLDERESKKHKERTAPTENPVMSLTTADFSALMKSRRENIFASLVGHRITLKLRNNGGVISGLFCLYGNQQLLPASWSDVKPNASPVQDHFSVCVGGELGAAIAVSQEENGWKLVATSSAASSARRRRGIQPQPAEHLVEEGGGARGTRSGQSCYFFEFETYSKHTEKSTKDWKTFLWLRSAYRLPDGDRKSSNIFEWLGVDWSEIAMITAENVQDGSDAAVRARRERVSAHANNAHTGTFQTDAEILEKTLNKNSSSPILFEKRLQKWTDGGDPVGQDDILFWPVEPIGGGSDSSGKGQGHGGQNSALGVCSWDQFEENEKTFGVKSTYVDGMYSTTLIMSEIPDEVQKRAQKLAEEMESSQRGRNPGRSHSRDAAAPGPHSRWRRFNDRDSHSVYTKLEAENCSYVDEDDEEARFSAVLPASTENRNRVSAQIKDRGTAAPPVPRTSKQQVPSTRGGISGANVPTGGTNTSRWPPFSSNPAGAGVRTRNRGYFAGGGEAAEADAGKYLKVQPETGGDAASQSLLTRPDESQTRHSLSPPSRGSGRPYQAKPTGGWTESPYLQKASTRPPAPESQRISTGQENAKAPRSVKDNINALNLEPIRSRHQYVIGIPQTVGMSEGRHPVLNVQDKKRAKKAEFLKALTEIQTRMERKGWNLAKPISGAVTAGGGSSPTKEPPQRKATISSASKDELSRVLHSTLRPTATADPDPDISREVRRGLPTQGTVTAGKPAAPESTAMPVGEKCEEKPKITCEGPEVPESVGGTAYTAEERLMAAKRMFQFNPNAHSFTPKEPASEGVITTSRKRVSGANGITSSFRAIDPQLLENRQRERTAKGQLHESSGGIENFMESIRLAAKTCGTLDLMKSPDWSPSLPISYMDLLEFEVIDSLSATSVNEPPTIAPRSLRDNGYGNVVQEPMVHAGPNVPQGLSHMVAGNPHVAGAHSGQPAPFLPITPALLNNMNLQANSTNANLRFALIPGGGMSLCESSVIGVATSGLAAAGGPYGGSSFIPFGTPQQFLSKSVTPQQPQVPVGQATSAPLTPTQLNLAAAAAQFGSPMMYGFPGQSTHHPSGRPQQPVRVHPHEGSTFGPSSNPNNTQPSSQIQQQSSGIPNGQNAQFMSPYIYPAVGSAMVGEHLLAEHRPQGDDCFGGGGVQAGLNPLAWYQTSFALTANQQQQQQQMFACLAAQQQQQQQAMFNQQAAYFYSQQAAQSVNDVRGNTVVGMRGGVVPGEVPAASGSGSLPVAKPAGATASLSCV